MQPISTSDQNSATRIPVRNVDNVARPMASRVESTTSTSTGKLSKWAYKIFLATLILVPVIFLPTKYLALDIAKTMMIVLGISVAGSLYLIDIFRTKRATLATKGIFILSALLVITAIISSLRSLQISKSLFGQGFEMGTTSFLFILFAALWVAYETAKTDSRRIDTIFKSLGWVFLFYVVFQFVRLLPEVVSAKIGLGLLSQTTDTLLGKWPDLGIFAVAVMLVSQAAFVFLPLSRTRKIMVGALSVLAIFVGLVITNFHINTLIGGALIWSCAGLSMLAMVTVLFIRSRSDSSGFKGIFSRIPLLPAVLTILCFVLAAYAPLLTNRLQDAAGIVYNEISLPWQMTIDVAAGSIKNYPIFGVGPNHFVKAFLAYKPQGINLTDYWSVEFNSGFGYIPTYISTLGISGTILWILFFVFVGLLIVNIARRLPTDNISRFRILSLVLVTVFLWLISVVYHPAHFIIFLTFVATGLLIGTAANYDLLKKHVFQPLGGRSHLVFSGTVILSLLLLIGTLIMYGKKTVALSYFANGVKAMTRAQSVADYDMALASYRKALTFDKSDVYWQAISEASRTKAMYLVSTATSTSPALANAVSSSISDGLLAARSGGLYDNSNYYNYLFEARLAQIAVGVDPKAYEIAATAYKYAISTNQQNPALYVSLAQLQALNKQYDLALQSLGSALQLKSNYLDAVFLLSQVHAARGDLNNAIIAAQVATQLNPNNPLIYFQKGLLEYNAGGYKVAAQDFAKALELEREYANAKYFLGLSAARIGDAALAINMFENLLASNPTNEEIKGILNALRAGRSPFADASTTPPEKRSNLPLKEKK